MSERRGQSRIVRAIAIGVVLAIGVWFRARKVPPDGLWLDEFGTAWAARGVDARDCVHRVLAVQGQSPLYYLIVRATVSVLGESEATLRQPTLVLGSLVPLLAYLAVGRAFGRRPGAFALAATAILPILIQQSREARPYPLAEAASLLALLCLARTLEGSARARPLAWAFAVAAVYAHPLFAPVLAGVALGLVLGRAPGGIRAVARDAALSLVALLPVIAQGASLLARRGDFSTEPEDREGASAALIGIGLLVVVAAHAVVVRGLWRETRALDGGARVERGAIAFVLALELSPPLFMATLGIAGVGFFAARYVSPAYLGGIAFLARLLRGAPRLVTSVVLFLMAALLAPALGDPVREEWREVQARLDALAPTTNEPILYLPGFIESNLVLGPAPLSKEMKGFLEAPLELSPGRPDAGRRYVLLPYRRTGPERQAYDERVLAPALEDAEHFLLVAKPWWSDLFRVWIESRFPGRFVVELEEEHGVSIRLTRYRRRDSTSNR